MIQIPRRTVLGGSLLTLAVTTRRTHAEDSSDPKNLPPQPGDWLVPMGGDAVPIKPTDLKLADDITLAWPADPKTKAPRDGTRLNQVLLMRFDPGSLSDAERARAADGVVAYSAICTHQGCTVTDWLTKPQVLQCPCHQSHYDPRHGAPVVAGPAPRPLPALPLRLGDGVLLVASGFTDRVGGEPQRKV